MARLHETSHKKEQTHQEKIEYGFNESFDSGSEYVAVVTNGGERIGNAMLNWVDSEELGELFPDSVGRTVDFTRLFIDPRYRDKGAGSFLLDHVLDFAAREGLFITNTPNPYGKPEDLLRLKDFYFSHGFKELKSGKLYWSPKKN